MMIRSRRQRGTSLIELLVVIVILLIGILGVIQVFPGGFGVLRDRARASEAVQLARAQIEMLKSRSEQLPEMIIPVSYLWNGANVTIVADPGRNNNDFSIAGPGVDQSGQVLDAGNNQLGEWEYLGASNIMRRIIGEGGRVPAPRQVSPGVFGGLMVLQFSPIVFNAQYSNLFIVYGNNMVRGYGDPGGRPARSWQYFLEDADEPTGRIHLPRPTVNNMNGRWVFRVQFTAWISDGSNTFRRDIVGQTANVPFNVAGGWQAFDLSTLAGLGVGESFLGADWDTVRVQHVFDEVSGTGFTGPGEVYEYKLLDSNLGVLLFPQNAYDYQERRPGNRRIPLIARVDYDVYDWRIIRDEFRITDEQPYQSKLTLRNIKVINGFEADNRKYLGMPIPIPDGVGGTRLSDVILLDVETGGIVLHDPLNPADPTPPVGTTSDYLAVDPTKSSFAVDKSTGMVRFIDADRTTPGLQIRIIYPGETVPTIVNASGRLMRALYRGNGEWSVQVLKAPATFSRAYGTPSVAQYYIGQTPLPGGGTGPGATTRIYFPGMDVGKKVVIGEIYYISGGTQQIMRDQEFTIRPAAGDPVGSFIDITEVDSSATAFDWSVGAPVKRVKGASVGVRVLWNPATFSLGPNPTTNLQSIEKWGRNWRRYVVDTYLQRGED